jgi:TonB family protein
MPVIRAVFLSLLFHIVLVIILSSMASNPTMKHPDVTEVDIVSPQEQARPKPKVEKQIVRNAFVPDKLKVQDDESLAKYLSQERQRVKKESQAALSGLTQNREGQARQDTAKQGNSGKSEKSEALKKAQRDLAREGFKTWDPSRELKEMNRTTSAGSSGASTNSDYLPNTVSVGSFTALNTDRFTFYTFYARIEELVRFRWETRVQSAIDSFDRGTVMNLGNRSWNSSIEFLLTPDGRLKSALLMKPSGVKQFDQAAINAFREAGIFPNPPQEMVQEDGLIHLQFGFTVNFNPSPMVGR